MTKKIKTRSDIKFNRPSAIEFDYSKDITDESIIALDKSMMKKSNLTASELHEKLSGGILVSGEDW